MKKILIILLILIVACSARPIVSNQKVVDLSVGEIVVEKSVEEITVANVSVQNKTEITQTNLTALPNQTNSTPKSTFVEVKPIVLRRIPVYMNGSNVYLVNNSIHRIEVIDVTEEGDGCLLSIDGVNALINKDEEARVNGIRVQVLDVRAMNDVLKDKDLCQVIIG